MHRIWFGLHLLPRCHAAFYNSDLCWANVQIAFLSAIPSVWAFEPERSQHKRDYGADLRRHHLASVTATCHLPLFPIHLSKRGTTAGMADFLCFVSYSTIISVSRKQSCRDMPAKPTKFKSQNYLNKSRQMRACQCGVYLNKLRNRGGRCCETYWVCIKARLWQTRLPGSSSLKIYSRCLCTLVLQTWLYLAQSDR